MVDVGYFVECEELFANFFQVSLLQIPSSSGHPVIWRSVLFSGAWQLVLHYFHRSRFSVFCWFPCDLKPVWTNVLDKLSFPTTSTTSEKTSSKSYFFVGNDIRRNKFQTIETVPQINWSEKSETWTKKATYTVSTEKNAR